MVTQCQAVQSVLCAFFSATVHRTVVGSRRVSQELTLCGLALAVSDQSLVLAQGLHQYFQSRLGGDVIALC